VARGLEREWEERLRDLAAAKADLGPRAAAATRDLATGARPPAGTWKCWLSVAGGARFCSQRRCNYLTGTP